MALRLLLQGCTSGGTGVKMDSPLRILHLEDEPDYSDLVRASLERDGLAVDLVLARNREQFEQALAHQEFDVILADYLLPDCNGLEALGSARQKCPQTPFLLLSGTIGEQAAIEGLKAGATDYILKAQPERLGPAVNRAVQQARERAQLRRMETELIRREKYFRSLTENALDILTILNRDGVYLYNSPSLKPVLGYEPIELAGHNAFGLLHPDDLPAAQRALQEAVEHPERTVRLEFRFRHQDGTWRYLEAVGQSYLAEPEIGGVVINSRDVTDRKEAEDSLRESEKQYRLIFDGNPTPMWVFDQETLAFLEVNDAAVQHYGYARDEFLKMKLTEIRAGEEVPALIEYLHNLLAEGTTPSRMGFAGIWRHRKKDGTFIDVEIKWSPIRFRGRAAYLSMVNDITERKRIEHRDAALSKLGRNLSSATCPTEAAGIIRDIADDLFRWDAFTLDLYSAESDLVVPILNVDTNRDGQRFEIAAGPLGRSPSGMARRVILGGAELLLRTEPITMPPDVLPMGDITRPSASLALAPVRNRTKVIGILSVQSYTPGAYTRQDLATLQTLADHCGGALERMRAEQALHESELLFHSVWENSVDGMRLTDQDGTMVAMNEAFCKLVGLPKDDLGCRPFTAIYADSEDHQQMLQRYAQRFKDRAVEKQVERRAKLRSGKEVVFDITESFVELSGQPPLLLGLFRDVTAQKRLEEQLRQSQKMEAIGQLAGGVAHDFNNILTVIHGHASLLSGAGNLTGTAPRSAMQITRAAERAAALTRQLLAFSRRQVLQPRRLDMNEVVSDMTKMLGRILGEHIALQLRYSPQPAPVLADASMMEQVLLNLAVNARDAMPGGGVLTIQISSPEIDAWHLVQHPEARSGPAVCLTVTDTGCGILPENLSRIFEPFFTTKEVGKGTGLGLATVYGIIKQHRGWIEVESRVGKGSTFKVFLPASAQPSDTKPAAPVEEIVRGGCETILVVEDEAPVRDLVCDLLTGHGYTILQAESGLKALEVWKHSKNKVDLLLTDLVMPDQINGRQLAEKLRADRPELKVIFTSGYSEDVIGQDFVLLRGLKFLQKPYPPRKLALAVRDCLDAVN
jgi:two-component system cell cycle sensor histidine kinase/response regulator CckA